MQQRYGIDGPLIEYQASGVKINPNTLILITLILEKRSHTSICTIKNVNYLASKGIRKKIKKRW